jgi:hypothetical protein
MYGHQANPQRKPDLEGPSVSCIETQVTLASAAEGGARGEVCRSGATLLLHLQESCINQHGARSTASSWLLKFHLQVLRNMPLDIDDQLPTCSCLPWGLHSDLGKGLAYSRTNGIANGECTLGIPAQEKEALLETTAPSTGVASLWNWWV